jgi:hypothetical protein
MFDKAKLAVIEFKIAICYFILFSINTLCSAIIISLTGKDWSTLKTQDHFLIIIAIIMNWTGTIIAFISQAARRIKQTNNNSDTQYWMNSSTTTNTTSSSLSGRS